MSRKRGSRPYSNRPPQDIPTGAPPQVVLAEFGNKLQQLLVEKNWNQSDLARAARKFMPDKKFTRDNVSRYVRGLSFPLPLRLNALAKALGVSPEDLRPKGIPGAGMKNPPREYRQLEGGMAWLTINQAVPDELALKILSMLGQEDADKRK